MSERPIADSDGFTPASVDFIALANAVRRSMRAHGVGSVVRTGHPGSKPKVAHTHLAAARKRERQARKAGWR